MKKTILTVFLVLAVLVAIFLVWELFFANTGILHGVYNAMANGVNAQWTKISGTDAKLIPNWDGQASDTQANQNEDADGGFNIDIER